MTLTILNTSFHIDLERFGASQLEGNKAIGDPYQKNYCFGQKEGRVVGGTK
jgi:hypothetical protein